MALTAGTATAIKCGHAVDDARVRLGAGFKWVAVRKMKKGNVPAASGRDGTPLFLWTAVLGDGCCGNKGSDYKLSCYWRIRERCGWEGPVNLDARQGLAYF